jgi:arylsulfate sulfotransferase
MGKTHEIYFVPSRVHHEIVEKTPGGNLLVATNAQVYYDKDDDTEDKIIEIDRATQEVVKEWDLRDIFDKDRPRLWTESVNDWCHLNAIQFDPDDNTLLISSKLQYFISKIDYETGDIKWILGSHEDWKEPWRKFLLTPTNFETAAGPYQDFTYAQHMPRLTDDGTILVYDNGASRPGDDYTRAVEFEVDPNEMRVTKIWEYRMPYVATFMGSIHLYKDGSVQIGHGAGDRIYEVTRDGEILFQAKTKTYYRAYSIELY